MFPSHDRVVFHDSRFIASNSGTKDFYISGILDGNSWSALNKASIVSAPDNITGLIRTNTDVWMFGEKTAEPWQNTGNADSPYERLNNAVQSIGTKNPWTIQKINNQIYFLGSNKDGYGAIWRTNGYGLEMVSTEVINEKINEIGLTTDARAYTYQEKYI